MQIQTQNEYLSQWRPIGIHHRIIIYLPDMGGLRSPWYEAHGYIISHFLVFFCFVLFCFLMFYFIDLFLTVLGLGCCMDFALVVVHRLLIAVASLVVEHRLWGAQSSVVLVHRSSCPAACGIFLAQGWNPCLLHWQLDSLPLDHQGSPLMFLLTKITFSSHLSSFWVG